MIHDTKNKRLILLVFSFFFIIYMASNGGHFDAYDGIETFLVTESMVLHHSAKLYPDVPSIQRLSFDIHHSVATNEALQTGSSDNLLKPMYTTRSLLLSAIAVPFYYAATIFSVSPIIGVAIFVNPLILSLISVVVFCFSLEVHRSGKIAFILSLIFGVCTFAWPYITTLVPQPLQSLMLIASAFFIFKSTKQNINNNKQNYFAGLGGLLLGFSLIAHPSSAIVIPAFVGYSIFSMWRNKKRTLLAFFLMLGIVVSFAGFINYWRFGSFTEFGYGNFGSLLIHHGWTGLVGLLVSPGKGIVFYFPMVILLPLALKYTYRENKGLFFLFSYIIIAYWLYFGTDSYQEPHTWTGTGGWGPRYLVPILPFISMAFGALLVHLKNRLFLKFSIIVLCVASFFVSSLGTIVWYQYGFGYGWERDELWKYGNLSFLDQGSYVVMTWFPQYSPIILHMKVLMSDYLSKVLQVHSSGVSNPQIGHDWAFIGLAPCSYDIYIYCKAGLVPILLLACIEIAVAVFILRRIKVDVVQHSYVREISQQQQQQQQQPPPGTLDEISQQQQQPGTLDEISQQQQPGTLDEISQQQQPGTLKLLLNQFNMYRRDSLKRSTLTRYYSLIISISISELKLRYKNSVLGFVWTFLQPLFLLGVFYIVFSTFIGNQIPYFPLYLLLGLIMWNMFQRSTSTSMMSFITMSGLLSKVYFPREILPITANITSFLMMLFDLCAFGVFVVAFHLVPTWTILYLPLLLIILFILTLGVSFALSIANVYFRDLEHIWGIVLQAGIFIVPIFFKLDTYPPYLRNLLYFNPTTLIIDMGHKVALYNTIPSLHDFGYLILASFAVLGIGYAIFKKFESKAIELL